MMLYDKLTDEQLAEMAASGDAAAEEELVKRYNKEVKMCSRPLFLFGGDSEDLIQEGMMGLLSAIRQFDKDRESSFRTYARQCIKHRMYTAVKSAARMKHMPLNAYVSIQSPQFDETQTIAANYVRNPEELLILKERLDDITGNRQGSLSKLEVRVLELYLEGLSYDEISKAIGKPAKSVDNAIQRIRKKLSVS